MKILQVNTVVNWGSTGKIADGIAQLIIANDWDSYIAYGRPKGYETDSCSKLIRIETDFGVKMHVVKTRLCDKHCLGSVRATKQFIKKIDKISPDIIHLHNIHGYYINIEVLFHYLANKNIPIVWTLHDCWPITGHCSHFDFVKCDKWQFECYSCVQKQTYPKSLFRDRTRKNYQLKKQLFTLPKNVHLVPVSNWLGGIIKKSYLGKYPMEVINNGIDTTIFTNHFDTENNIRHKYFIPETAFMVLGVANIWNHKKGLNDFIELSKKVNTDVIIVLIGLTEKQKRRLPHGIIGIERTQSIHELASFYRAADLFVNPTWEDNFPTTNIEALACGCPVLTYDTGGSIEAVTPETGFIVSRGDINSILHCIEKVRANGRESYCNICRERAIKNYDKYIQFSKYIKLYNQCSTTKPSSSPEAQALSVMPS